MSFSCITERSAKTSFGNCSRDKDDKVGSTLTVRIATLTGDEAFYGLLEPNRALFKIDNLACINRRNCAFRHRFREWGISSPE